MSNDYDIAAAVGRIEGLVKGLDPRGASKTAAILAGAGRYDARSSDSFLANVKAWRRGDTQANEAVKGIYGVSDANGAAIAPNNFVAGVAAAAAAVAPWRSVLNYVTVNTFGGVDIPYEVTAITAALAQGAYGSNKDNRDFTTGLATASMVTLAQIVDIGNQLLRATGGAAEEVARRRLGRSIGLAESNIIVNGTDGILPELMAFGDVAAFKTTLSSEPRAATLGRAIGALAARGHTPTAIILEPNNLADTMSEGLGTSYAGGWAIDPSGGPTGFRTALWGVPIYGCSDIPDGTGLVVAGSEMDAFLGSVGMITSSGPTVIIRTGPTSDR